MLLQVCLFDEDGNEYASGVTIDVDGDLIIGFDTFEVFEELQNANIYSVEDEDRPVSLDDLVFLAPHYDEKDTNIVLRIREKDSHEDVCDAGSACSLQTCREWYSSNLVTMTNLRTVEN